MKWVLESKIFAKRSGLRGGETRMAWYICKYKIKILGLRNKTRKVEKKGGVMRENWSVSKQKKCTLKQKNFLILFVLKEENRETL